MDWGLGNPNKTAALVACLMVAIWSMAQIWRRGFWLALPIFTVLAWCLIQTYSRGGMLALLAGTTVLLVHAPRPWPKERWIAVLASLWIVGAFILFARAETRYSQGLFTEDQSISSRLVIWRHFPEMLAAAPWGWGWGKSGDAYTQWFQPATQSVNYLNLVNSHLTWMAEGGWAVSTVYLFAWITVLLVCWPTPNSRLGAVPFAVWVAFGVAGCFSHIEESIWIWIVPLLMFGYALVSRLRLRQWPKFSNVALGGLTSIGIIAILIILGSVTTTVPIRETNGSVVLGRSSNTTVIFVDRSVMGKLYGHTFRKFLAGNEGHMLESTFILTESPFYRMPSKVHEVIISGRLLQDPNVANYLNCSDQIVLVNPNDFPGETRFDHSLANKTRVYFGEYSQAPSRSSWSNYPGIKAFLIDGASDFVPSWPQAVLNPPRA